MAEPIKDDFNYTLDEYLQMPFKVRYSYLKNMSDPKNFENVEDKALIFTFLDNANDKKNSYYTLLLNGVSTGIQEGCNKHFGTQLEALKKIIAKMQSNSSNFLLELLLSVLLNFNLIGTVASIGLSKLLKSIAGRSKFAKNMILPVEKTILSQVMRPGNSYNRYSLVNKQSAIAIAYNRTMEKITVMTGSPPSSIITQTAVSNLKTLFNSEPTNYDDLKNRTIKACKFFDDNFPVTSGDWPGDAISTSAQISIGVLMEGLSANISDAKTFITHYKESKELSYENYKKVFDLVFDNYEDEDFLVAEKLRGDIISDVKQLIYKIILVTILSIKVGEEGQNILYLLEAFNIKFVPNEEFNKNDELLADISRSIAINNNGKLDTIYNHSLKFEDYYVDFISGFIILSPSQILVSKERERISFRRNQVFKVLNETKIFMEDHEFKNIDWVKFK